MDRLFERKSVKTQKHIYFYLKFVQTHEQTLKAETFVTVSYKIFLHIQSFFTCFTPLFITVHTLNAVVVTYTCT